MKAVATLFLFLVAGAVSAVAQNIPDTASAPRLVIEAKLIGADSVIIPYNDQYVLTATGCATMLRHGRYNFKARHFYGIFKDLSIADTTKILNQGEYSADGLKNGDFLLCYPNGLIEAKGHYTNDKYDGDWLFYYDNGNLMAKGTFNMDKYVGNWEWYYEDGRPFLNFETLNGATKILYQWGPDGTAFVKGGNGTFQPLNFFQWTGKLVNGLPDSTWLGQIIFDADTTSTSEFFNKTKFIKGFVRGAHANSKYEDKSRMVLSPRLPTPSRRLPSLFIIDPFCDGSNPQKIIRLKIFGEENFYETKTNLFGEVSFQMMSIKKSP